jgi:hypothetical protein
MKKGKVVRTELPDQKQRGRGRQKLYANQRDEYHDDLMLKLIPKHEATHCWRHLKALAFITALRVKLKMPSYSLKPYLS